MIQLLIAVLEKIDAKCMTLFIGKVEEEETQRTGDSLKSAETVVSEYPNGQAYAQKIKPTGDTCYEKPIYQLAKNREILKLYPLENRVISRNGSP